MEQALVENSTRKHGSSQLHPRVFINHSGLRPAEPTSLAVAATHHTLTHLTLHVAKHVHKNVHDLSSSSGLRSADQHQQQPQSGSVVSSSGRRLSLTPKGTAPCRNTRSTPDRIAGEDGGSGGMVSFAPTPEADGESMLRGNFRDVSDAAAMVTTATVSGISKVRFVPSRTL